MLAPIIKESRSYAQVLKALGLRQAGGSHSNLKRLVKKYKLDTSHFLGRGVNRGATHLGGAKKKQASEILVLRSEFSCHQDSSRLRRALLEIGRKQECETCGQGPEWNGKPLQLQIDHRNGKRWDNRPTNVRFLCPNCHTQTENFGSKNNHIPQVDHKCKSCGTRIGRQAKTGMCPMCAQRNRKDRSKNHAPVVELADTSA